MGEKIRFYQFNVAWSILLTFLLKLYTVNTRVIMLLKVTKSFKHADDNSHFLAHSLTPNSVEKKHQDEF